MLEFKDEECQLGAYARGNVTVDSSFAVYNLAKFSHNCYLNRN